MTKLQTATQEPLAALRRLFADPHIASLLDAIEAAITDATNEVDTVAAQFASQLAAAEGRATTAEAALAAARTEMQTTVRDLEAAISAERLQLQSDKAANDTEMETIRANTKKAITEAAQFLQALTQTELSEPQQAAVAGLSGVLAFASKPEIQRQYEAAVTAAAEATRKAEELAAKLQQ